MDTLYKSTPSSSLGTELFRSTKKLLLKQMLVPAKQFHGLSIMKNTCTGRNRKYTGEEFSKICQNKKKHCLIEDIRKTANQGSIVMEIAV